MAIDDLLDEHEQSERVRSWLRGNAAGLLGGVLLGLALIGGWKWWQQQQQASREAAGASYQAAVQAIASGDLAKAKQATAALKGDTGIYGTLVGLQLAKAQADQGKRDDAIATLRGLSGHDAALDAVVQTRLARLLLDAGKPVEALALVGGKDASAQALELRGDALLAQGKAADAQAAYAQALARIEVGAPQRRLVELKLTGAGGDPRRDQAGKP